ncbi:hypothetical protein BDW_14090 [Bdellovibrio bacteriovorus W]|nr:hypothetical protein BDW_14090 [Bdellovibrio bacteriovorus W]
MDAPIPSYIEGLYPLKPKEYQGINDMTDKLRKSLKKF